MGSSIHAIVFNLVVWILLIDETVKGSEIAGYVPNWVNNFNLSYIKADKISILLYAFCPVVSGPSLACNTQHMAALQSWSAQHPNVKIVPSIGGATYESHFAFFTNDQAITTFVNDAWNKINQWGFAGLDVDWEYPRNSAQKQTYGALIKKIHDKFGTARPYIMSALPPGYNYYGNYDADAINKYLKYPTLMAYDYHGSWESTTNHNAPIYGTNTNYTIDASVRILGQVGVDTTRMLLGLPFYAKYWTSSGSNVGSSGTGQPDITYKQVKQMGLDTNAKFDSGAQATYNHGNNNWVSFDNAAQIDRKIKWACVDKGMKGAMIWELSQDGGTLLDAVYDSVTRHCGPLGGGTASTGGTTGTTTTRATTAGQTPAPTTSQQTASTTTTSGGSSSGRCSPQTLCQTPGPGNMAATADCRGYIACSVGHLPVVMCPSNLVFNQNGGYCDWPGACTVCT